MTQYEKGTRVEAEHKKTYDWLKQCFHDGVMPNERALYAHIAMDHLDEKVDYYDRLEEAKL